MIPCGHWEIEGHCGKDATIFYMMTKRVATAGPDPKTGMRRHYLETSYCARCDEHGAFPQNNSSFWRFQFINNVSRDEFMVSEVMEA